MGQTLSSPTGFEDPSFTQPLPALASDQTALPSSLPPYNTTLLDPGHVSEQTQWHIQGGRLRFPIPQGYHAACSAYGQKAFLTVESSPSGDSWQYVVRTEGGDTFAGSTPTAPFAKWALVLPRIDVVNGLEAFGFVNPTVQAILRRMGEHTGKVDLPVAQLAPGAPVGAWARGETPAPVASLVQEITRGAQQAAAKNAQRAPSSAPSLQNWLSAGETAAPRSPQGTEGVLGTADAAGLGAGVPRRPYPISQQPPTGSTPFATHPIGLPPRPAVHHAPVPQAATQLTPGAHAKALANRPGSRSRRRPGSAEGRSSGRGWTAFTAFGLAHRDAVREANPLASATEIERLLGRQWAALTPEEKQHFVDVAAEVRRSSQGNYPLGVLVGAEGVDGGAAGLSGEGGPPLRRTRSDAGSEERQLRPTRRPRMFGPEYDTSDAPWSGRKGSLGGAGSLETELDKVYAEILAAEEAERLGVHSGGKRGEEEEGADEADVLGVLADMRAEAIASESRSAGKSAENGRGEAEAVHHDAAQEVADREAGVLDGASEKIVVKGNGEEAQSLPQLAA